MCWFLDAGNNATHRMLSVPAAEKRQGTKSREVGHWRGSECYGYLMPAPSSISVVDVALATWQLPKSVRMVANAVVMISVSSAIMKDASEVTPNTPAASAPRTSPALANCLCRQSFRSRAGNSSCFARSPTVAVER
jgi:hypothetical protein